MVKKKHLIMRFWCGKLFSVSRDAYEMDLAKTRLLQKFQILGEVEVPYPPLGSQTLSQFYEDRNKQAVRIWKQKEQEIA